MWLAAYRVALWLLLPLVLLRLWWRGLREPGYRSQPGGRLGLYQDPLPSDDRPMIWLHAVSLGETRAAEPLVKALATRFPEYRMVITHMTATGRDTARQLFAGFPQVELAWLPYDYPFAMRNFLARFRPRVGILMETEVWPNLVEACEAKGVPLLLANARMSEKSARSYGVVAPLSRKAFARLTAISVQTQDDADRLFALGARREVTEITGNLKFDVAVPGQTGARPDFLRERTGNRPVFLAASTRDGEEQLLLDAIGRGVAWPTNALVLLVPRHPQRFNDVAAILEKQSLRYVRRSDNLPVPADCRFLLGDSLGEMAAYYAVADCAFVGGSLLPLGGQNLIEACAMGVPVLVGPHTFNFAQAAAEAVAAGAALRVGNADELVIEAGRLLGDTVKRDAMKQAGIAFCNRHRGATDRILAICERLLAERAA